MSGRTDYCPNIIFNQSQVYNRWVNYTLPGPADFQLRDQGLLYHQGKRGHSLETDPVNRDHHHQALRNPVIDSVALESLGDETSNLFREAFFSSNNNSPRKKSKLSERLTQKLSKLAQSQLWSVSADSQTDHSPSRLQHIRSASVDSKSELVLSRRQILASLEEERSPGSPSSPSPSSSQSSTYAWTPSSSSPRSPSLEEPVFSRACLLQSISKEEDWGAEPADRFTAGNKCDSGGETLESSDDEEEDEENIENNNVEDHLGWEEEQCEDLLGGEKLSLKNLKWIATLGVGGFGRVELVTAGHSNNLAFALKKMKKNEIQDSKQQQHILNEKAIMASCESEFIVKLYRTYQDTKYLYMLMEPCLGGELWTLLRRSKRFSDGAAAFYVGCVILAFDYLHEKGVIYRDLKPENLLLDSAGYVKLTDFGFSRQLEEGEVAWTFCGTPEYVAPEIITNKSHDLRADIWSLGILVFELLTGAPPFTQRNSSGQVYPEILKGMKSVHFPGCISASASEIIRLCCRLSPGQRPSLAHLKHFMWFSELDWVRLADRSLPPPNVPTISNTADYSNFDTYSLDSEVPADDYSDWSKDF